MLNNVDIYIIVLYYIYIYIYYLEILRYVDNVINNVDRYKP